MLGLLLLLSWNDLDVGLCHLMVHVFFWVMFSFFAAFHAYGKPGKTLVEMRQVLNWKHNLKYSLWSQRWSKMTFFPHLSLLSLQYDWLDAGDLHCLLCCDRWSGLQFLCTDVGFRGLESVFPFKSSCRYFQVKSNIFKTYEIISIFVVERWTSVFVRCCWSLCLCSSSFLWACRGTWCHPCSPSPPWLSCSMPSSCSRWVHTGTANTL